MTARVLDDAPASALTPEVEAFAAAVRAALDDLEPEERDDLTDGIEAELLDRVADSGVEALGDPDAYAAELRAAAGLPPRTLRRPSARRSVAEAARLVVDQGRSFLARHPFWRGLVAFLVSLRPAWWVLRAVVAYQLGAFFLAGMGGNGGFYLLPLDGGKLLVLALLVVVSVQLGRGRWQPRNWMRVIAGAGNVILLVAAPFVAAHAIDVVNQNHWSAISSYDDAAAYPDSQAGMSVDGNPVTNVFAYDAEGNPLPEVRLYDQDGQPLYVASSGGSYTWDPLTGNRLLVPSSADPGDGWNVYPLATVSERELQYGQYGERISPEAPRLAPGFPFAVIPPLVAAVTEETPEAGAGDPDAVEADSSGSAPETPVDGADR